MSASNNNINLNSSSKRPIFSLRSSSTVDFDQEANYDDDTNNNKDQSSERLVPIANVGRIMKQILPNNAKISKEAKETMQECVSEFIGFVTSEASEKCRKERRKTVNGDDICWAMGTLGFDDYAGPLKRYLNRFRDIEGNSSSNNNNQNNSRVGVTNGDEEEIMLQENFLLYTSNEQSKELG